MKPARFVINRPASIVDSAITRPLAVGERHQQVRQLRVAVLLDEPRHRIAPAPAAGFTDNRERRGAKVRQRGVVSGHTRTIARAQERIKNAVGTKKPRAGFRRRGADAPWGLRSSSATGAILPLQQPHANTTKMWVRAAVGAAQDCETGMWREGPARVAGDAGAGRAPGRLWSHRARQSTLTVAATWRNRNRWGGIPGR